MESKLQNQNQPLYLGVKGYIQNSIEKGTLQIGDQLPTEVELASEFEVSRHTVRQALGLLAEEGWVEKIHGKGTFVANVKGVTGNNGNKIIHFIVPELTESYTGRIVTSAQKSLYDAGFQVSVFVTNNDVQLESTYIQTALETKASGLIIHATKADHYNPEIFNWLQRGLPLVMTTRYRYLDSSYVQADNYGGAYDAVSHLISLGHKQIGLVSKPTSWVTSLQDRIAGYRDAMGKHGLAVTPNLICSTLDDPRNVYGEYNDKSQEERVLAQLVQYIKENPEITAVVALNDLIAADVIRAARICGKQVPEDFSVIGFDNVSLSASLDPPLTTVASPLHEIGQVAAESILGQIEQGGSVKPVQNYQLYLPMSLIIRQSCSGLT